MKRERLDAWCERGVVGLLLLILAWGPLAFGGVRPREFLVLQGLTVLLMALWLLRFWLNPGLVLIWPPAAWAVLAFMGYAVLRYCFADLEYLARQELARVLVYGVLFLACLNHLHRRRWLQWVAGLLVLLAAIEAGFGIYQFLTHAPRVWGCLRPEGYLDRASGTYMNPDHLAGFLEMIVPIGVAYVAVSRAKPLWRILVGYATLVSAAGLVLTVSRGGWVAAAFGLVCLVAMLLHTPRQGLALAFAVAVLLGAGLYLYSRSFTLQFRVRALDGSLATLKENVRFQYAQAAFRMWKDHPWFGVGPDHYDARFRNYRAEVWVAATGRPGRAHNDYLNLLADWGLVGGLLAALPFGLIGWSLACYWRRHRRAVADARNDTDSVQYLVWGAAAGLAAILVHSACDFNLHIPANAILALTLLAVIAGRICFSSRRSCVPVNPPLRWAASILLIAGAFALRQQARRSALEQHWLASARAWPALSTNRIDALKQAFAVEPHNAETAFLIGEEYRFRSWDGHEHEGYEDDYRAQAAQAREWFQRASALNPYDSLSPMETGACLDWVGRHAEAAPYFRKALELDPNGYRVRAMMGWHYLQVEDYEEALKWFDKSLQMNSHANPQARAYQAIALEKLAEKKRTATKP